MMSHSIHPDHLECWRYKQGLCNGVRHCPSGPQKRFMGPEAYSQMDLPKCCSEIQRATIYIEE
jgi:hypothetical protein